MISFKNQYISLNLKSKKELKSFLSEIFRKEGYSIGRIMYLFTSDEALYELNKQFLKQSFFTDILTFPTIQENLKVSAEIFISVPRVKENALKYKVSFLHELYRVIIHGILHLCGYSDYSSILKAKMREREDFYLSQLRSVIDY